MKKKCILTLIFLNSYITASEQATGSGVQSTPTIPETMSIFELFKEITDVEDSIDTSNNQELKKHKKECLEQQFKDKVASWPLIYKQHADYLRCLRGKMSLFNRASG